MAVANTIFNKTLKNTEMLPGQVSIRWACQLRCHSRVGGNPFILGKVRAICRIDSRLRGNDTAYLLNLSLTYIPV